MQKLLIVEDEFIIAYYVKELLEKKQIGHCTILDTFEESKKWIKNELPDLVLLDIRLFEDEDAGIRLAHYLQNNYSIPFIFISGYSDEITLKNAKLYKPATFITKPIIEKQLLAAVEMALPEQNIVKTKSILLKGRYIESITYSELIKTNFSEYDFVKKTISFDDITVIQSFNHIKRNTVLFKFRQPNVFFVTSCTIEKLIEVLPSFFKQVHQSFIVNTNFITSNRRGHYLTVSEEKIPIGAAFREMI